jgi:hypothetical protein
LSGKGTDTVSVEKVGNTIYARQEVNKPVFSKERASERVMVKARVVGVDDSQPSFSQYGFTNKKYTSDPYISPSLKVDGSLRPQIGARFVQTYYGAGGLVGKRLYVYDRPDLVRTVFNTRGNVVAESYSIINKVSPIIRTGSYNFGSVKVLVKPNTVSTSNNILPSESQESQGDRQVSVLLTKKVSSPKVKSVTQQVS